MERETELKKQCPELDQLPNDWKFRVDLDRHISFLKRTTGETSYNHPTLGGLPKPWILKLVRDGDVKFRPMYYNEQTHKQTQANPRYMASTLARHSDNAPPDLWIAASSLRNNTNIDLGKFKRTPINYNKSIRDQYTVVHAIDPGDGSLDGMNGGVFVVAMKGLAGRIFIEKRFKSADIKWARREIEIMFRANHASLTNYIAAFVLEHTNPAQASLYVEFCDRGSLDGLIRAYITRHNNGDRSATVPECFVWHALIGLADGLAYLQSGVSIWQQKNALPDPQWTPILHRDIKPDNVLLRSRNTLGSKKYFYCVLSDFGLACDDRDERDPRADRHQVTRAKLGTKTFWAPELCYHPYPRSSAGPGGEPKSSYFPPGQRHSKYSDLWALGASIYNLCKIGNGTCHIQIDFNRIRTIPGMTPDRYVEGTESRERYLTIPHPYSQELRHAILVATAWDPRQRPSPLSFIQRLDPLVRASGHANQGDDFEPLPDWATKVHEYHAKAEKITKNSR
jgi:NIMA (never in mitosis gene a)-related kinase